MEAGSRPVHILGVSRRGSGAGCRLRADGQAFPVGGLSMPEQNAPAMVW
jgi:hypothetical protein